MKPAIPLSFLLLVMPLLSPAISAEETDSRETPQLPALEIRHQGKTLSLWPKSRLEEESLPQPQLSGFPRGLSLLDFFPPLKRAQEVTLLTDDGTYRTITLPDPESPGPLLQECILLSEEDRTLTLPGGETVKRVILIDLEGRFYTPADNIRDTENGPAAPVIITQPKEFLPELRPLLERYSRLRDIPVTLKSRTNAYPSHPGGLGSRPLDADLALVAPGEIPPNSFNGNILRAERLPEDLRVKAEYLFHHEGYYQAVPLVISFSLLLLPPGVTPPEDLSRLVSDGYSLGGDWYDWKLIQPFLEHFYPDPLTPEENFFTHPGAPAAFDQLRYYFHNNGCVPLDDPDCDGWIMNSLAARLHPPQERKNLIQHPLPSLFDEPLPGYLSAWGLARLNTETSPLLSQDLIAYLTSPAVQALLCQGGGVLPVNPAADSLIPADEARLFRKLLADSPALPTNTWDRIGIEQKRALSSLLPLFMADVIDSPLLLKKVLSQ